MALRPVRRGELISAKSMNELIDKVQRLEVSLEVSGVGATSDLSGPLQSIGERLLALENAHAAEAPLMGPLLDKVQSLAASLTPLEQASAEQGTLIDGLASKTQSVETRLSALEGTVTGRNSGLNDLSKRAQGIAARLSALEKTSAEQGLALSGLSATVQDLAAQVAELERANQERPRSPILAPPVDLRLDEIPILYYPNYKTSDASAAFSLRLRETAIAKFTIHPSILEWPSTTITVLDDRRQPPEGGAIQLDGRAEWLRQKAFFLHLKSVAPETAGSTLQVDVKQGDIILDRVTWKMRFEQSSVPDRTVWLAPLRFELLDINGRPDPAPFDFDKATGTIMLRSGSRGRMHLLLTFESSLERKYLCSVGVDASTDWKAIFSSGPGLQQPRTGFERVIPHLAPRIEETYTIDIQASSPGATAVMTLSARIADHNPSQIRTFKLVAT